MTSSEQTLPSEDQRPGGEAMLEDVLAGLAARPRRLSPKYFYDARGSALFEDICQQPEYYLTRAELALMDQHIDAIAAILGPRVCLVEYGSGSGIKTRMLLQHMDQPVAYLPVEISRTALEASIERLQRHLPDVVMLPVVADFTQSVALPAPPESTRRTVVYFPGSTIGNFEAPVATRLLANMARVMGPNGMALIGADRVKDPAVMTAAYNDAAGVTARFTLNMLARFNRELGADFDPGGFRHVAEYNNKLQRIETFIESCRKQDVHLAGQTFHFAAGERMLVEISCKYSRETFARLAAAAGLAVFDEWTDPAGLFSLFALRCA